MLRPNPLLSVIGWAATLLLLAWLGVWLILQGGLAFSPGELSAQQPAGAALQGFRSHADFEGECQRCHAPFAASQDQLCMECHTGVKTQIAAARGPHGSIPAVQDCAACHPDHQGADFDPRRAAFSHFDHSRTRFSLLRHPVDYAAAPLTCEGCHRLEGGFGLAAEGCIFCHAAADLAFMTRHLDQFGEGCTECHDGQDRMAAFQHQQTGFDLTGRHAGLDCAACHTPAGEPGAGSRPMLAARVAPSAWPQRFAGASTDCAGCHAEPAQHRGFFPPDCAACHTSAGWLPARLNGQPFEHTAATGFSLAKHRQGLSGAALTCSACHSSAAFEAPFDPQTCTACHASEPADAAPGFGDAPGFGAGFIQTHTATFGPACQACHDGSDRLVPFEHSRFFALAGRHAELDCAACHAGQVFAGTPSACAECHAEPKLHAGFFGLQCQLCHSSQAWRPAPLRQHPFPLQHGASAANACETCHTGPYTSYTCYGCHDHQPEPLAASHEKAGVAPEQLPACAACHPGGQRQPSLP